MNRQELATVLAAYHRGEELRRDDLAALQEAGLLDARLDLTLEGSLALLAYHHRNLLALGAALTRDHHGSWWVHGGRNADYNAAMDALLGRPEPRPPRALTRRKGPRRPKLVIR